MKFSVCVLLFGDNLKLAELCLESIRRSQYQGWVKDFRIGLNRVTPELHTFATDWAEKVSESVWFYEPLWPEDERAFKYPVMRRMFRDPAPAAKLMWFDDDSYLMTDFVWADASVAAGKSKVLGQCWHRRLLGNQWAWMRTQSWFNSSCHKQAQVSFPQGAWWIGDREFLQQLDYPCPELRHYGGDMLLGEICRHKGVVIAPCLEGVMINAGFTGTHSGSPSRSMRGECLVGQRYAGRPLTTAHQDIRFRIWNS